MDHNVSNSGHNGSSFSPTEPYADDQLHSHQQTDQPLVNYLAQSQPPFPHALFDFYTNRQEAPWSLLAPAKPSRQIGVIEPMSSSNFPTGAWDYRSQQLVSECDESRPGDSGYASHPSHSLGRPSNIANDFPEGAEALRKLHFGSQSGSSQSKAKGRNRRQTSRPRSATGPKTFKCQKPDCEVILRTKSELNKHVQRHDKPHVCDVPGCPRKGGFSTKNDLQRHRKTVHSELYADSPPFYCHFGSCAQAVSAKRWPRADNFRQHVARVHSIELKSEEDISRYHVPPLQPPPPSQIIQYMGAFDEIDDLPRPESLALADTAQTPGEPPVGEEQNIGTGMVSWHTVPQLPIGTAFHMTHNEMSAASAFPDQDDESLYSRDPDHYTFTDQPHHEPRGEAVRPTETELGQIHSHFTIDFMSGETSAAHAGQVGFDENTKPREPIAELREVKADESDSDVSSIDEPICQDDAGQEKRLDFQQTLSALPNALLSRRNTPNNASSIAECLRELFPADVLSSTFQVLMENEPPEQKPELVDSEGAFSCELCPKSFPRRCELKKHRKRHDKPYGCTFRDCDGKFGSKNDWKRHESSQHLQLETWSCPHGECSKICNRRESFKNHMIKAHDEILEDKDIDECRFGRHCDSHYWCGFCQAVQVISSPYDNCWTLRCNHIDDHLCGRHGQPKQSMANWLFVEDDPRYGSPAHGAQPVTAPIPARTGTVSKANQSRSLKRKSQSVADPRPRKKELLVGWQCCHCADPLFQTHSNDSCTSCNHQQCADCEFINFQKKQRKRIQETTA